MQIMFIATPGKVYVSAGEYKTLPAIALQTKVLTENRRFTNRSNNTDNVFGTVATIRAGQPINVFRLLVAAKYLSFL